MTVTNTDYCTSAQLKSFLRISDTDDDTRIASVITATSRAIDHVCGQVFSNDDTASDRYYRAKSPDLLYTHPFHSLSGFALATNSSEGGEFTTTWDVNVLLFDQDAITLPTAEYDAAGVTVPYRKIAAVGEKRFPVSTKSPRVKVTATWGWEDVPDAVREACIIKAARLFRRRDTPEGLAGGGDFGLVRISSREDPDVMALLAPYIFTPAKPVAL